MPSMSRRAYARSRNVSEAGIRRHIASGLLADAVTPSDLLDSDRADRLLADSVTRPKTSQRVPVILKTARQRRQRAQVRALNDEVMELQGSLIEPADAKCIHTETNKPIIDAFRRLVDAAPLVAGQSGTDAFRTLDRAAQACLQWYQDHPPSVPNFTPEPDLEIDNLTPVELSALQADLQAQRLEILRLVAKRVLVPIEELGAEYNERMSVSKSLFDAIPGRLAALMASATEEQARTMISREVEQALAVLND